MKVALVTGTDQGLGLEMSRQLINKGAMGYMGALNAETALNPAGTGTFASGGQVVAW
jgi:NAD(P)-dependent dehydrogenase (short-subunit alcohol dehydrogenase family)